MRILLTALEPGINYSLRLRSKTSAGAYSAWSIGFNFKTITDTTPPAIPTGLKVDFAGSSFSASWNAVTLSADGTPATDLKGYIVKLASPNSTVVTEYFTVNTYFNLSFDANVTAFSGSAENIAAFGSHPQGVIIMSIAAVDKMGNTSPFCAIQSASSPPPDAPTSFAGSAIIDGIKLTWTDSVSPVPAGWDNRIYWGITSGFIPSPSNMVFRGNVNTFVHSNVLYLDTSYYKIATYNSFNVPSAFVLAGPFTPTSPFVVDITPPLTPLNLSIIKIDNLLDNSSTSITIKWDAVTKNADAGQTSITDLASYMVAYRPSLPALGQPGGQDWQYSTVDFTIIQTSIGRLLPFISYDFKVRASDWSGNVSVWSNVIVASGTTDIPTSQPAVPIIASYSNMQVQISHFGKKIDGITPLESYFDHFDVYVSPDNNIANAQIRPGGLSLPTLTGVFPVWATTVNTTWYAWVKAISKTGIPSVMSPASIGTNVNLISGANIADATIGTAKIADLQANKITAGTGLIANLTVKSVLTLGDASTNGVIQSFNYDANHGFFLSNSSLVIHQGSIDAAALNIQIGNNLMTKQYAGFEFNPASYTNDGASTPFTIKNTGAIFGTQYLSATWGAVAQPPAVYLSQAYTGYNIDVEASTNYIISAYYRVPGTVSTTVRLNVKYNNTNILSIISDSAAGSSNVWKRISGTISIPNSAVTKMLVYMDSTTLTSGASFDIDAVQVEKVIAGSTVPSSWSPPSSSSISGGYITTGQIISNTTVLVNNIARPAWSINLEGGAQFGNALVRGAIVVGAAGDPDLAQSFISSGNYLTGSIGWKIDSSGAAEFNTGVFRGSLGAGAVTSTSLSSDIILSGKIRTAVAGARVELNPGGLQAFDYYGTQTMLISSYDGSIKMTGGIISGGTISGTTLTGVTINGGTFITANSTSRIEMGATGYSDPADEIRMWNSYTVSSIRNPSDRPGRLRISLGGGHTIDAMDSGTHVGFTSNGTMIKMLNGSVQMQVRDPADSYYGSVGASSFIVASSRRYKVAISDRITTPLSSLMALTPKTYIERGPYEANYNSTEGLRTHLGLIAEEVSEIPVLGDLLVLRDDEGRPEAMVYDRVGVVLIPFVQDLLNRVAVLEAHTP